MAFGGAASVSEVQKLIKMCNICSTAASGEVRGDLEGAAVGVVHQLATLRPLLYHLFCSWLKFRSRRSFILSPLWTP